MTWDYATGEEYVFIEVVEGNEVVGLVTEIPIECPNAEKIAEEICNSHNFQISRPR